VIDRPAMLLKLAMALPMIGEGVLASCCEHAEALRTAVSSGVANGGWGPAAAAALASLKAEGTELAFALEAFARALGTFSAAGGAKPNFDIMCLDLVMAGDRLHRALADPVKGLHAVGADIDETSLTRSTT